MVDVTRMERMLKQAVEAKPLPTRPTAVEVASDLRFLRDPSEYRVARGGDHD